MTDLKNRGVTQYSEGQPEKFSVSVSQCLRQRQGEIGQKAEEVGRVGLFKYYRYYSLEA